MPRALEIYLFEGASIDRSKQLTHGTMFLITLALLFLASQAVEVVHTLSQRVEEIFYEQVLTPSPPPEDKRFEIVFAENSPLIYEKEIIVPVMIIREEPQPMYEPEPEPIPEPIPEPVEPPPPPIEPPVEPIVRAPEPVAEATQTNAVADAEASSMAVEGASTSEFATTESTGASGDQIIAELLNAVNRYKEYPRAAERAGIQGINYLNVTIDPDGRITGASLTQGSGNSMLDGASQDVATQLRSVQLSAPNRDMSVNIPIQYSIN